MEIGCSSMVIKWRKYTKLPLGIEPLVKGENASCLKNIKYPEAKDFKGQPWGIVDFSTGKVIKPMSQKEYDSLFVGIGCSNAEFVSRIYCL